MGQGSDSYFGPYHSLPGHSGRLGLWPFTDLPFSPLCRAAGCGAWWSLEMVTSDVRL